MSALNTFSTFSPAYQNIANRMTRLKQHKSTQSLTQIRPNSARKVELNVFAIDPKEITTYQPRRRLSPTNVLLADEVATIATPKNTANTGKVAKNTGLKKYNQTQFKDITHVKNTTNSKTQTYSSRGNFIPCVNQNVGLYNIKTDKDEIKMVEQTYRFHKNQNKNLISGRIYSRQALHTLFA